MPSRLVDELRGAYAEFIASFLFVFFGAGSVSGAISAVDHPWVDASTLALDAQGATVEPVNYALSFGFGITILAFAIGDVSGGHINAAVTLAFAVTRNITVTRAVLYVVMQLLGALAGGAALVGAVGAHNYHSGIGLAPDVSQAGGFALELMGT
jgi:glycerol uptake facilitator-like aquaporin